MRISLVVVAATLSGICIGYLFGAHWGGFLSSQFYWIGLGALIGIQAVSHLLDRRNLKRSMQEFDTLLSTRQEAIRRQFIVHMQERFGEEAVPPEVRLQ